MIYKTLIATALMASMALPAHAYVGPGLAVAIVAQIFGGPAAIVVTILMVLFFPFRMLYKKLKKKYGKNEVSEKSEEKQIDSSIETKSE